MWGITYSIVAWRSSGLGRGPLTGWDVGYNLPDISLEELGLGRGPRTPNCCGHGQFWAFSVAKPPIEWYILWVDLSCLHLVYPREYFNLSFICWFWHGTEIPVVLPSDISHLIKAEISQSFCDPYRWLVINLCMPLKQLYNLVWVYMQRGLVWVSDDLSNQWDFWWSEGKWPMNGLWCDVRANGPG